MSRYVVDASVAIKWVVPEDGSLQAAVLLEERPLELYAPDLLWAEAGNVLWKKVQRGELGRAGAPERLYALQAMTPIAVTTTGTIVPRALEMALAWSVTVYDACYLALAERQQCTLLTADGRLAGRLPPAEHRRIVDLASLGSRGPEAQPPSRR